MRYDTPLATPIAPAPGSPPGATPQTLTDLPWRQQLRHGFRDMGSQALRSAKNFGMIGAAYAGTECCIEGLRARDDVWNSVAAGAVTGGILAIRGGPQAVALGAAGFAAFSAAIEVGFVRRPEGEQKWPVA